MCNTAEWFDGNLWRPPCFSPRWLRGDEKSSTFDRALAGGGGDVRLFLSRGTFFYVHVVVPLCDTVVLCLRSSLRVVPLRC